MTTPPPAHEVVEQDGKRTRLRPPEQVYGYVVGAQFAIDRLKLDHQDEDHFNRGYRTALDDVIGWLTEDDPVRPND